MTLQSSYSLQREEMPSHHSSMRLPLPSVIRVKERELSGGRFLSLWDPSYSLSTRNNSGTFKYKVKHFKPLDLHFFILVFLCLYSSTC